MNNHIENLIRDGYSIVSGTIPATSADQLRLAFSSFVDDGVIESVYPDVPWFRNLLEHLPETVFPIVTSDAILEIVEGLMGPQVQLDGVSLIGFPTGLGDPGTVRGWHRDRWAVFPPLEAYQRPFGVHCLIYCQDVTDKSGPLRVIPGSHRNPVAIQSHEERLPHRDEILLYPEKGEVVMLDNSVLHSGTLHDGDDYRVLCSVCYQLDWLKQPDRFDGPNCQRLISRVQKIGCPRLSRLLGASRKWGAGPNRANYGFLRPEREYWEEWFEQDQQKRDRNARGASED